jgi:hypothetical protein
MRDFVPSISVAEANCGETKIPTDTGAIRFLSFAMFPDVCDPEL